MQNDTIGRFQLKKYQLLQVLMSTRSIKNTNDTSRNYMVSYLSYCAHTNNNKALFSSFDELQVYFIGLIRLCSCCQNDYIFSQRFMRTPYMRYRLVALQIPFLAISVSITVFSHSNFLQGFDDIFSQDGITSDVLLAISKSYKLNIQKQNDQRRKVAVNTISKNKFYLFDGRSLSSIISTFLVCTHRSVRENCKRRRLIII